MADAEEKKIARLDFGIDKAISSLDKIDKKLKTVSETSEQYAKNIGLAINNGIDYKTIAKSIGLTEKQLKRLTKVAQEEAIKTTGVREREAIKTTNVIEREHAKQADSVKTLSDKITNYASTYLIYQGFNMLKRGISETIEEMVELENQMVQIDRVLNESDLNINEYRNDLLKVASDYGNSMNNVADITLRLAQAGYSSTEALELTKKTLLALNTAELDATQATDDMVAVMAQWGLNTGTATEKAEAYGAIIDKINKVADNYPTTSADLLDALKKTSSAFNLAGASIDETIALITAAEVSSQRGGKAIGTALSNITQQLKDDKRLTVAESLGLDFYTDETKTQFKDITQIFGEMSAKMQELKDSGKENSVEMQNLLSIFTVFRRNVGASLLGEMSGEDSTYFKALEDSLNSAGYSMQENAKYMGTTLALQNQFNNSLLELKTEVWDNGVENVYRSMLALGSNVVEVLGKIIDTFGALPTAVGAATGVLTLFNKQLKVKTTWNLGEGLQFDNSMINKIKEAKKEVANLRNVMNGANTVGVTYSDTFKKYVNNIGDATVSTKGYIGFLVKQKLATLAAEAATIALNVALSMGISLAVTGVIKLIDNLIHAEERAIEKQKELIEQNQEMAKQYQETADTLREYLDRIKELEQETGGTLSNDSDSETLTKVMKLQGEINSIIGESGKKVQLVTQYTNEQGNLVYKVTDNYRDQLKVIKEIEQEERKKALDSQRNALTQTKDSTKGIDVESGYKYGYGPIPDINTTKFRNILNIKDTNLQIKALREFKAELESAGQTGSKMYEWISEQLGNYDAEQQKVNEELEKYLDLADDIAYHEIFDDKDIDSAKDFEEALNEIGKLDIGKLQEMGIDTSQIKNIQEFKDRIVALAREDFPTFTEQIDVTNGGVQSLGTTMENLAKQLNDLQNQYSILTTAQKELKDSGEITASTFASLIDNNLLDYLDVVNGKVVVNTKNMDNLAESLKVAAIAELQKAAADDIEKLALGDVNSMSITAKNAIAKFGDNAKTAGNKAVTAASQIAPLAAALAEVIAAAEGTAAENNIEDFKAKANAIANAYKDAAKKISNITISGGSSGTSRSSGGSSSASKAEAEKKKKEQEEKRKEEEKKKKEEEKYKKRLDKFKETLDKMTDEEEDWVRKQQELGMLSNKDMLYVTKKRISRYNKYLDTIKKATWMNKEDRKELMEKYTEEIEDLELEYFEYLKAKLDEEVKAVEDARDKKIKALEDEYDKKIKKVEDAADAEIKALQKVEDERNRLREKEDYESERQGILDEIAYWEQRTGREAVESLADAKKRLEELDQEWARTQEDWATEDAIKKIEEETEAKVKGLEEERDKKIKTAEETAKKEIELLQKGYNDKVKIFSETDKIIYDNSKISAKKLYNAYKDEFVDPLKKELEKINGTDKKKNKNDKKDDKKDEYVTYTIKKGDTLSAIAKKYNTTVKKIMAANDYIKDANKIYAGKKLKIPKFHEGGIVGGNEEAFALLKPHEVILKPEWAEGINKLAMMAKNNETITNNSHNITVKGDLVRIDANIKDKNDAEYLTRKIEKMLKDKFNIKK